MFRKDFPYIQIKKNSQRMVGVRGFEPPTPRSQSEYSARLSYTPITEELRGILRLKQDIE